MRRNDNVMSLRKRLPRKKIIRNAFRTCSLGPGNHFASTVTTIWRCRNLIIIIISISSSSSSSSNNSKDLDINFAEAVKEFNNAFASDGVISIDRVIIKTDDDDDDDDRKMVSEMPRQQVYSVTLF